MASKTIMASIKIPTLSTTSSAEGKANVVAFTEMHTGIFNPETIYSSVTAATEKDAIALENYFVICKDKEWLFAQKCKDYSKTIHALENAVKTIGPLGGDHVGAIHAAIAEQLHKAKAEHAGAAACLKHSRDSLAELKRLRKDLHMKLKISEDGEGFAAAANTITQLRKETDELVACLHDCKRFMAARFGGNNELLRFDDKQESKEEEVISSSDEEDGGNTSDGAMREGSQDYEEAEQPKNKKTRK